MPRIKNFNDIHTDKRPPLFAINNDLLRCAHARNNTLTRAWYSKDGEYSLLNVFHYYGTFEEACRQLKIKNPDNINDYEMIVEDIKRVLEEEKKIDADTYKNYGAYDYEAINKKYEFKAILRKEKLLPVTAYYPNYPVVLIPRATIIKAGRTYHKKFIGGII